MLCPGVAGDPVCMMSGWCECALVHARVGSVSEDPEGKEACLYAEYIHPSTYSTAAPPPYLRQASTFVFERGCRISSSAAFAVGPGGCREFCAGDS